MTNSLTSLLDFIRRRVGELVRRQVDHNSNLSGRGLYLDLCLDQYNYYSIQKIVCRVLNPFLLSVIDAYE